MDANNLESAEDKNNYKELIDKLCHFFPIPFQNEEGNALLIEIISKQLSILEHMKSKIPYLGKPAEINYATAVSKKMPENISSLEEIMDELTKHINGIPVWAHPHVVKNVLPPAAISAILGNLVGAICNPNIIEEAYSLGIGQAEVEISSMCADLIGYDPKLSTGISTFGGTGTVLYGVKLGIEKASPGTLKTGLKEELKLVAAKTAHYCKYTIADWLGLGMDNVVSVGVAKDNSMDKDELQNVLHDLLKKGKKIACIIATMGSTDSFGIDDLEFILQLRDSLVQEYRLPYIPHVHADAVIGWAWTVFNEYDFDRNPMAFPPQTIQHLKGVRQKLLALSRADSIGIDFHKTGYTNYVSSLFLIKDKHDLQLIVRDVQLMPYLFQEGSYHPGTYTLETTRAGGPVLAAYANLRLFGKEGYRALLGHIVALADYFRRKLENHPLACIVNAFNFGPVVLFRFYPLGVNAKESFNEEMQKADKEHEVEKYNEYNRRLFQELQRQSLETASGFLVSFTDLGAKTVYGKKVLALKCYMMTPFATESTIDELMLCIDKATLRLQSSAES